MQQAILSGARSKACFNHISIKFIALLQVTLAVRAIHFTRNKSI